MIRTNVCISPAFFFSLRYGDNTTTSPERMKALSTKGGEAITSVAIVNKRLHKMTMKGWPVRALGIACVAILAIAGCSGDSNPLAPYEGERPLQFLAVTQSFTPQIQWVGGRVAAVGVNRGPTPALDSTLVWMMEAEDNTIGSFVSVGDGDYADLVAQYGGVPRDSLRHGETYTFWMAEREVVDANLDASSFDGFNFADTTMPLDLLLNGRTLGGEDVEITITREETLSETRYVVQWTPADVPFRQIGITQGRVGGFTDLAWHVVLPDGADDAIYPPVVIGDVPEGADEVVPWSEFEPATYIFWMTTSDWDGTFGFQSEGYAYFQIFDTNFTDGS